MKHNSIKRVVVIISFVVAVFTSTFNLEASPISGFQPKIVQNGIRYRIINEPWIYPIALVCRFDDTDENNAKYSGNIELPDSIKYDDVVYSVIGLDDNAFDGCIDLEELILPNTIEILSKSSIANCGDIKLKFPANKISCNEYGVFYNTRIIEPFDIPDIFYSTGGYFFSAFPWIEDFTFTTKCLTIGRDTFKDSNISRVEFENDSIFLNCSEDEYRLRLESCAFANANLDEIKLPFGNLCIYNSAFFDQPQLKKLTFSNTPKIFVKGVDMGNFESPNNDFLLIENCQNLEEIVCESITPPAIVGGLWPGDPQDHAIIMDDNSNTILKVPSGSEQLYAEHPVWGQFANISDINGNVYRTASLGDIQQTSQTTTTKRVIVDGSSTLSVRLDAPSIVSVVNINGIEVCRESAEAGVFTTALAPGVYIVTTIAER